MSALLLLLSTVAPGIAPGTYTNEEEVYFDQEAKREAAPWTGIRVDDDNQASLIDRFGKRVEGTVPAIRPSAKGGLTAIFANGRASSLRRARPVTCWGSVPRSKKKPDGSDDWYFAAGLKIHDQGGRVKFGGADVGTAPVILRVRNVVWQTGPNKPSLVLYVHTPDQPDRAVSYSWADPEAKRIGINLRWMQASCTIDQAEDRK